MKNRLKSRKDQLRMEDLTAKLKAVAHPRRIAIIELLSDEPGRRMTVNEICATLKMEQPEVSKHLGILRRHGITKRYPERNYAYFELNKENRVVGKLLECISKK